MGLRRRDTLLLMGSALLGGSAAASAEPKQNTVQTSSARASQTNSDAWPLVNRDLENSSRNPNSRAPDQNLQTATNIEEGNIHQDSYTAVDEDFIYVAPKFDGSIKAFDRETGQKEWTGSVGGALTWPFSVGENYAYAASGLGDIVAFDKTDGTEIARERVRSGAEVTVTDSGNVIAIPDNGEIKVFDEDLSNGQVVVSPDPEETAVSNEVITVDDSGRAIYVEDGSSAKLRMFDPETADVIAEEDIGGNIENGAVLHDNHFIYQNDDDLVAYEVTDSGFGGEAWRVNTGRSENSPVAFDGKVFSGNSDGEVYKVDVGTGDRTVIDQFDVKVDALVASEYTLFAGDGMRNMRVYDLETGDLVNSGFDDYINPDAVVDGNLVVRTDYNPNTGNFSVHIKEGDYREIVPDSPSPNYSVSGSGVIGDDLTLEADVNWVDGPDMYEWSLDSPGLEAPVTAEGTDLDSWDITEEVSGYDSDTEVTADLTVTDQNGETGTYSDSFTVELLDPALNGSDRVTVETETEYTPDVDQTVVDQSRYFVDGEQVGTGDTLTHSFGTPGEYSIDAEFDVGSRTYTTSTQTEATLPPIQGSNPPQDLDGDSLYEDIRGDGERDVFDVQTLFNNMDSPEVDQYSQHYNFQGSNPDSVTVFDVQSLFGEL